MDDSSTQHSNPAAAPAAADRRELLRWQRRLLPFTMRFLVALVIAFFALSMYEVYEMRTFIKAESAGAVRDEIKAVLHEPGADGRALPPTEVAMHSLLLLEADAIDRRYRHVSALLMSRVWSRQLSFITGMVLSFIGAVFILSKLTEGQTEVAVGAQDWKSSISSSSPGLVLAFFGTLLLLVSMIYQPKIELQDRPIYFGQIALVGKPAGSPVPEEAPGHDAASDASGNPFAGPEPAPTDEPAAAPASH